MAEWIGEGGEGFGGAGGEVWLVGELSEAEKVERSDGIGGWFSAVVVFFDAEEDVWGVLLDTEIASTNGIAEESVLLGLEFESPSDPSGIEVGFVEVEEALDEHGVVVAEACDFAGALAVAAVERAIFPEFGLDETSGFLGGGEVDWVVEDLGGAGEGGDGETIPSGNNFVIEMGSRSGGAEAEEFFLGVDEGGADIVCGFFEEFSGLRGGEAFDENIGSCEFASGVAFGGSVAFIFDAEDAVKNFCVFGGEGVGDCGFFPGIKSPFGVFWFAVGDGAIGIFGGVETALGIGEIAEDVVENIAGDIFFGGVVSDLEGVEVGASELGLIVEHFFEVGDVPEAVDGIAVEAAAQMIMDATGGHLAEGKNGHGSGGFLILGGGGLAGGEAE